MRNVIHGPLTREALKLQFKDVVDYTGIWNWSILQMVLPSEIINELKAMPTPQFAQVEGRLAWKYSPRGGFDLKSAYLLSIDSRGDAPFKGDWI